MQCYRCGRGMDGYPDVAYRVHPFAAGAIRYVAHGVRMYEDDPYPVIPGSGPAKHFAEVFLCEDCLRELITWMYGPNAIEKEAGE